MDDALSYSHDIFGAYTIANVRDLAIDSRLPGTDQFFHFPPRPQPRLRQQFLQFLRYGV
jgi:hypothetical protein